MDLTDSVRSASLAYTPTLWGSRTITFTNNMGLAHAPDLSFLGMVQLGHSGMAPSGNRAFNFGGFDLLGQGPWLQEMKRDVSMQPGGPELQRYHGRLRAATRGCASTLHETTANGGNSFYGMPFNVVPGTQPLIPFPLWNLAYAGESDPRPGPFPTEFAQVSSRATTIRLSCPPLLPRATATSWSLCATRPRQIGQALRGLPGHLGRLGVVRLIELPV